MPAVVLDASFALNAVFPDEHEAGPTLGKLLAEASAIVPPIWPAEVVNGLQFGLRRGRIDRETVEVAVRYLGRLPITVAEFHIDEYAKRILPLAERHRLSIYDASYLHLAIERRLSLATLDRRLHAAAQAENVARR
jgi:predicted nucleic acid-binding protein